MNIFDQYGIKEVADVTLYSIELDENDDEIYVPVLYLDTLKISSVEETAEQTSARGGLGNPELIIWDYGKEITVTLEDALYSPASQGMTWGGKHGIEHFKFYGKIYSGWSKDVELEPARFEVEKVLDFFMGKDQNGKDAYCWNVTGNIISKSGKFRQHIELMGLYWSFATRDWCFGGLFPVAGQEEWLVAGWTEKDNYIGFYYLKDMNSHLGAPQDIVYQIDHALNNVYYLDRMEKCRATQTFVINTVTNTQHGNYRYLEKYSQCELTVFIDPKTMQPYETNTDSFTRKNGEVVTGDLRVIKQNEIYYKWTRSKAIENTTLGHQIIVDAIHFPGTYRLVGETYSRSRKTGKDQRFQFEIPLCKMGTENSFTLEAEGEPTTFNMTLKVLRREDGVMMKLTQYSVDNAKYDGYMSDSTNVIPSAEVVPEDPTKGSD